MTWPGCPGAGGRRPAVPVAAAVAHWPWLTGPVVLWLVLGKPLAGPQAKCSHTKAAFQSRAAGAWEWPIKQAWGVTGPYVVSWSTRCAGGQAGPAASTRSHGWAASDTAVTHWNSIHLPSWSAQGRTSTTLKPGSRVACASPEDHGGYVGTTGP